MLYSYILQQIYLTNHDVLHDERLLAVVEFDARGPDAAPQVVAGHEVRDDDERVAEDVEPVAVQDQGNQAALDEAPLDAKAWQEVLGKNDTMNGSSTVLALYSFFYVQERLKCHSQCDALYHFQQMHP